MPEELEAMDELSSTLAGAPGATDELQEPGIAIERIRSGVPSR